MHFSTKHKLAASIVLALCWFLFSLYISFSWIERLAHIFNSFIAYSLVMGIALIPGFFNIFLVTSLIFDNRPKHNFSIYRLPPISILVAAYNEEECIVQTLESIFVQDYDGPIEVIVSDDGSTDDTSSLVSKFITQHEGNKKFTLLTGLPNRGKSEALNRALDEASHDLIITVDGDSYLYKDALLNIVKNFIGSPKNTGAIAGTVLVRNSRKNWLTKLQEWEYFISLSAVKRSQSLCQGTLVAQGAFSLYTREALQKVKGWRKLVGEDIVLTWALRKEGYRVGHAENAIIFTNVPETYRIFFNQRRRWSRGLIEAFKQYPEVIWKVGQNSIFIWLNLMFPFLDTVFLFGFVPGLIAALFFHWYELVSLMTLILLPMAMLLNYLSYREHVKTFDEMGLKVRNNKLGYISFMLCCQFILVPACIRGYVDEFLRLKKTWVTKEVYKRKNRLIPFLIIMMPFQTLADYKINTTVDYIFDNAGFQAIQDNASVYRDSYSLKQSTFQASAFNKRYGYNSVFVLKAFKTDDFNITLGPGILASTSGFVNPAYAFNAHYTINYKSDIEFDAERSPLMAASNSFATVTDLISDNLTLTSDYKVSDKFTIVGGIFTQQIENNSKNGFLGKLVYNVTDNFIISVKSRVYATDHRTPEYFSPTSYQQHWFTATYVKSFNEDFVFKAIVGPGITEINGITSVTRTYDFKIIGVLSDSIKSDIHYNCLSATYGYEYCTAGASLQVNF